MLGFESLWDYNNYPRGQMGKPSDLGSEDFVSSTLTGGTTKTITNDTHGSRNGIVLND